MELVNILPRPTPEQVCQAVEQLAYLKPAALRECIELSKHQLHRELDCVMEAGEILAVSGAVANPYGVIRAAFILAREEHYLGA